MRPVLKLTLKPAVFFDRDGVLNQTEVRNGKPYAPKTLEDFKIFPEAKKIIEDIKKAGFLVIVVTNQPDVGNGLVSKEIVETMHRKMQQELMLDAIKVCYHAQSEGCYCRKPKPGMLLEAASEFEIDLTQSIMVGDRIGDMVAGKAAGCRTIFIDYQYAETQSIEADLQADLIVTTLEAAAEGILEV
jgi:D-glycero-D-manno-heptose 1,7-bisphosphate phosphatase